MADAGWRRLRRARPRISSTTRVQAARAATDGDVAGSKPDNSGPQGRGFDSLQAHQAFELESASLADTFAGTGGVMGSQRLTFFPMEPPRTPLPWRGPQDSGSRGKPRIDLVGGEGRVTGCAALLGGPPPGSRRRRHRPHAAPEFGAGRRPRQSAEDAQAPDVRSGQPRSAPPSCPCDHLIGVQRDHQARSPQTTRSSSNCVG